MNTRDYAFKFIQRYGLMGEWVEYLHECTERFAKEHGWDGGYPKLPVVCKVCGKTFYAKYRSAQYCSKPCRDHLAIHHKEMRMYRQYLRDRKKKLNPLKRR